MRSAAYTLMFLCLSSVISSAADTVPAFPGAEGFASYTLGGRGGRVVLVTNLKDYVPEKEEPIPGSLRAACQMPCPRIVVFRVAGNIALKTGLVIDQPYLTLAGQSAPGGGICVTNYGTSVRASHVVIRYMRFRPGDAVGRICRDQGIPFECDALSIGGSEEGVEGVLFDHCSTSWANDEVLSVSGAGITNVTVQWCIISESLNESFHKKGNHGYGSLLRCNGNVTFHHNLYAHHASRSPRPGTYGEGSILLDFRNNVIFNSNGYTAKDPARINYVGNYILRPRGAAFRIGGEETHMYVADCLWERDDQDPVRDWDLVAGARDEHRKDDPFPCARVSTDDPKVAFERILKECGAAKPVRDAIDHRIMESLQKGEGDLIDSQEDVGGYLTLGTATPPVDGDEDGMPDAWETENGLDPKDPTDAAQDRDGDGYTNIEEWLNLL